MKFVAPPSSRFGSPVTRTSEWYSRLKDVGAKRLTVSVSPKEFESHKDSMWGWYSGEVPWAVRVEFPVGPDFWSPEWKKTVAQAPSDGRIWDVAYRSSLRPELVSLDELSLDDAASQLRTALNGARMFASKAKMKYWPSVFEDALERINSTSDELPDHSDLLPKGCCVGMPRKLLASGLRSWVFGGMGWWNDVGPFLNPIKAKNYRKISEELYHATLTALTVGANNCID